MDYASRALALLFLLPLLAVASASEKTVYHVQVQGTTQLKCKITHRATKSERYLLLSCDYRCDNPVGGTIDAKTQKETIFCRGEQAATPATQGETLDTPSGDDQ
jgi:hypothetical protein